MTRELSGNCGMLELRGVTQEYRKGNEILRDINVVVRRGEFVSVIGPSGAGKTTLLRLMNGAVPPSGGEVYIYGERFDTKRGADRRKIQQRIGTIYQDFCLVGYSTCLQNVLNGDLAATPFWRVLTGFFSREQTDRAMEALTAVGVEDKAGCRVNSLSGGQKQRVAIARTLMSKPRILLADEPVASLDPVTARQILDLIKGLQQTRELTVVMNSHNIESALEYSDRVIGIKGKTVVVDAPAGQVNLETLKTIYGEGWKDGR